MLLNIFLQIQKVFQKIHSALFLTFYISVYHDFTADYYHFSKINDTLLHLNRVILILQLIYIEIQMHCVLN